MLTKRNELRVITQLLVPSRAIPLGFVLVIALGTLLLKLPFSHAEGVELSLLEALFTATSSVCITGLSVVDTATAFSFAGKCVIIVLIQIGGLGFMTIAALMMMMLGHRITLRERLIIQESLSQDTISGVVKLARRVTGMTFACELTGAAVLATRFVPLLGWGRGLFFSAFHAISAFCNAGFDLFGGIEGSYVMADPVSMITLMALIVVGGLGYTVIFDIIKTRSFKRLRLHSKLALVITGALVAGGAAAFALIEWNNPETLGSGSFSAPMKVLAALFQSITTRTAGFAPISQSGLRPSSKLLTMLMMFIGASPASTGGGIKTTTAFLLLVFTGMVIRGRDRIVVNKRSISQQQAAKAVAVFFTAAALVFAGVVILAEDASLAQAAFRFEDLLYETVSAYATVGLSTGITAALGAVSKIALICLMFAGRVGALTLMASLSAGNAHHARLRYPEGKIIIG